MRHAHPHQRYGQGNVMEERNGELLKKYGVPILISVVGILVLLLWLWSYLQPEGFKQRIAFIELAATVMGGAILIGGLLVNFWGQWINQKTQDENQKRQIDNQEISLRQLRNAQEQLDLTRRGQITERFTKAIEQLGDDKVEVRLGGIAALEQIADQDESSDQRESSDRRWQIMEILTAYVRGRAQYESNRRPNRRDYDIQAVLNVIGELTKRYGTHRGERYLSLAGTDLMDLDLSGFHLQGVNLQVARLEGANLQGTHLEGAYLGGAHLEGAHLGGAHLDGAELGGAKLAGADIGGADLLGATFQGTEFEAEFSKAEQEAPDWWTMLPNHRQEELKAKSDNGLVRAELTQEIVEQINGDWSTKLPSDWSKPVWWSTLSSSLPSYLGEELPPGEYHIKLGTIPLSFSVDEGWQADLSGSAMPYAFSLIFGGSTTVGSIIEFHNVHSVVDPDKFKSVIDPDKPGEFAAAVSAKPPDLFRWFSERCSAYLEVGKPEQVHAPIGEDSAIQFEVRVSPGKGIRDIEGAYAPVIPYFPRGNPRSYPFLLFEGFKNLVIVHNVAGETIAIIVTSPESAFEELRERSRKVLDTVKWLTQERLEEAKGDEST